MPAVIHESRHRVACDGDKLSVVVTMPADGDTSRLAVLLHGGPGGKKEGPEGLYVHLARQLADAGIGSVRFDFRGCGESSGRYRDMTIDRQVRELAAVRDFVDARFRPSAWAMVGESFGATIGVRGLDADYRVVVLLWPAIWLLEEVFESYVVTERLQAAEDRGYIEMDGEEIGLGFLRELLEIHDVSQPLQSMTAPVLFVHGDADTEVPVAQSIRASRLVTGEVRLVQVPGGEHCLVAPHEREIVYRETVAWLRDHL